MRDELETEQNCNILTPALLAIRAFLFRSPGLLNRGPGGPASLGHGSHSSIFSPTDLNFLSPGLYNNLTPTYTLRASQFRTQFNPSTVQVAPDLLISSTCAPVIYTGAFLFLTAWPSWRSICNIILLQRSSLCILKPQQTGQVYLVRYATTLYLYHVTESYDPTIKKCVKE